jgi:hypothetical protein
MKKVNLKNLFKKILYEENNNLYTFILYHGTNSDNVTGYKNYKGIYLTSDQKYAKRFGKNIFKVRVFLKNPYILELPNEFGFEGAFSLNDKIILYRELTDEDIENLKTYNYDGIVVYIKNKLPSREEWKQPLEIIVFDKNQIEVLGKI